MKNVLKLNIRMFFFEESILELYTNLNKKSRQLQNVLKAYIEIQKKIMNLLQKSDLNKKVENYKLKKL